MRHHPSRCGHRSLRSLLEVLALSGPPERRPSRGALLRIEALEGRVLPTIFWAPQLGNENAIDYHGQKLTNVAQGTPIYPIFWGTYWTTPQGQAEEATYDSAI